MINLPVIILYKHVKYNMYDVKNLWQISKNTQNLLNFYTSAIEKYFTDSDLRNSTGFIFLFKTHTFQGVVVKKANIDPQFNIKMQYSCMQNTPKTISVNCYVIDAIDNC